LITQLSITDHVIRGKDCRKPQGRLAPTGLPDTSCAKRLDPTPSGAGALLLRAGIA